MRGINSLLILFCCLFVALSGLLVLQIRADLTAEPTLPAFGPDSLKAIAAMSELPELERATAFEMPPLETYNEVLDRPLFSMERRAVLQPSAPSRMSGDLRAKLIGIVSSSAKSVVLMRLDDTGEVIQLLEGDRVKGWMLISVSPERAIFERGGEEVTFELAFEAQLDWEGPSQTDSDEELDQEDRSDTDTDEELDREDLLEADTDDE